jgi:hypothetical protein
MALPDIALDLYCNVGTYVDLVRQSLFRGSINFTPQTILKEDNSQCNY